MIDSLEGLGVHGGCEKEKQTSRDEARYRLEAKSDMNLQEKDEVLISPSQVPHNSEDYSQDFVEGYWNDDYE